ncbi:MAG: response regulator transcription factor [Oscillospiraceae bacterium]|nr:response regulator transcription factor [Oscillospiraceae bacterium]
MKLLFAEDEKSLSRAVKMILEKSNYVVDAVYDGAEALDYLAADSYDGVILDIMMPKKDGITVLREMRERGDMTPVLLLTAKSEIDDKVLGLDSGANDYLTKPFDSKELLARLRAMLRVQHTQTSSALAYGNVTLDTATCTLASPSGSYKLAGKEYGIMELFMRSPAVIISAERILERVWGYESDADINVVWVYLSYLRKKLSVLDADVQIKATRGAGYSLEMTK